MTRERNAVLDRVGQALPLEGSAFERLQDRRDRRVMGQRLTAGAVGIAATIAVVAVLITWASPDERRTPSEPGTRVAPLVAAPGEYYYVKAARWSPDGGRPSSFEIWVGTDDSGRTARGQNDTRYGADEFPGSVLLELSTDPDILVRQLVDRGSPEGASPNPIASTSPGRSQETTTLLRTMQDLLTLGSDVFLTPEQTAALQDAASGLEDVTTEAELTDPLGREATRLSWVVDYGIGPGSRVLWYFEPTTGQFLGEYWVDQRTGSIERAGWVLHAGIAPSIDDVPAPSATYVPRGGEPNLGPIDLPPAA